MRTQLGGLPGSAGFTLAELLVVLAVSLIVAAFAVPEMVTTLDAMKLRGTLTSTSNMIQRARTQAIKSNQTQRIHFATVSGKVVVFVTTSTDTAIQPVSTDANLSAQLWFPTQFSIPGAPTSPAPMTTTFMWGSNISSTNQNVDPYFSSRGMPCLPDTTTKVCQPANGFVYYYKYSTSHGVTRWAATSISPAGRVQNWFWNGSTWGN